MTTSNLSTFSIGWVAIATGAAGALALAFLILLFTVGQPFGTLNDICIGVTAILSVVLAWTLYSQAQAQLPFRSGAALLLAGVGALVVMIGSVLVISGITGWYLAGLYMAVGNALIGVWLLGLSYSALQSNAWSHELTIYGIVTGAIMLLGLAALPGIFTRIDAWDAGPWYVNYIGQTSALGYLVLYPIWCLLVGRVLLGK